MSGSGREFESSNQHQFEVEMDLDSARFKKQFWDWFDSISTEDREKFQEYPADMAEIFFYNRYYREDYDL